jgi:four helix bundle protein
VSQPHENLVAWQRADDLCVTIHRLARETLPASERFELGRQLRRAAYSVAANIVEGYSHSSVRWRLQYLRIALGSLAELGYGVHLATRLGYLSEAESARLSLTIRQAAAPLQGLVKRLSREVPSHRHE